MYTAPHGHTLSFLPRTSSPEPARNNHARRPGRSVAKRWGGGVSSGVGGGNNPVNIPGAKTYYLPQPPPLITSDIIAGPGAGRGRRGDRFPRGRHRASFVPRPTSTSSSVSLSPPPPPPAMLRRSSASRRTATFFRRQNGRLPSNERCASGTAYLSTRRITDTSRSKFTSHTNYVLKKKNSDRLVHRIRHGFFLTTITSRIASVLPLCLQIINLYFIAFTQFNHEFNLI